MPKLKSCGFLIVRPTEFVADEHRPKVDSFLLMVHPDRLDLPKGHVDKGETNLECAFRELLEETGIRKEDIRVDETFKFKLEYPVQYKDWTEPRDKRLIIYLAYLVHDVEITVTEHEGFEWRKWNPPHKIQAETIDPLLAKVAEHLSSN
ncbi:MAG: NUDIX domain-containing protein [Planctomycetales bacterium]|nr:NUDIX domain-containing protein [Planctomycetales bacterium]